MQSCSVRARDGRDDETAATVRDDANERNFLLFAFLPHAVIRRRGIVVHARSSTRITHSTPSASRASRRVAMRCVPLALPPARVARALSDARTAFIVEVVHASIAFGHTSGATVSRRSRGRRPPEPWRGGFRVQACVIDRRSIVRSRENTVQVWGVLPRTIVRSGLGHMKWCFGP